MSDHSPRPCTAFRDATRIASGPLPHVALAVKAALSADPAAAILVFDDDTGKVVDLDLRGSGRLSFVSKTVDLRADVVLSEELSAQAGRDLYRLARDGKRIVLPATITGSMSSPTVFIDIQSALQRALRNRTEDALKDLFDRFRKKE